MIHHRDGGSGSLRKKNHNLSSSFLIAIINFIQMNFEKEHKSEKIIKLESIIKDQSKV